MVTNIGPVAGPVIASLLTNATGGGVGAGAGASAETGGSATGGLSYIQLSGLTLEAVFQTVIICLLGYLAARAKLLTPDAQKQISHLNVMLFTPCLVFSKLGSSLSLKALVDIAVIPIFYAVSTGVSLGAARFTSWGLRLDRYESNFVTAMAVFGNSNSLPVSLTVALAYTLPNLTWPDLPSDNQDDVASRGILYLLIFQQLGQILRWSWGYNTLLAPAPVRLDLEPRYHDEESELTDDGDEVMARQASPAADNDSDREEQEAGAEADAEGDDESQSSSNSANLSRSNSIAKFLPVISQSVGSLSSRSSIIVPDTVRHRAVHVYTKIMGFMNPPLWAMLAAIFVAAVPSLQNTLFKAEDGFLRNTVTSAVKQVGNLAIPLILVVLGANLAPDDTSPPKSKNYNRIVFASLVSRMVLPAIVLLPLIALSVKYVQISILDDPIFLLVAFILTVAPPAIQLSQICTLNSVFEREMAGILFWGYVVLTLPSTIFIVVSSLEVIEWAGTTKH